MGYRFLAALALRFPKTMVALWAALTIGFGLQAVQLPTVLKDHGLLADGAFVQVQRILAQEFGVPEDPVLLVFEKKQSVTEQDFRRHIELTLLQLRGMDGLIRQVSPLEREGMLTGRYAYAVLELDPAPEARSRLLGELENRLLHHPWITVRMTGKYAVQEDVNRLSRFDLRQAELIGLPVALLICWFAFGGFVPALIPVLAGMSSVAIAMGVMYKIGTRVELSNFVLNVIPMVGLALSIDFALIFVSRFREELRRVPADRALLTTLQTAGRAVLLSAGCVLLGLGGTLFIRLPMFTTVALSAMTVLLVSLLATLTLLPAVLVLLRHRLIRERRRLRHTEKLSGWTAWAKRVIRRPVPYSLLAGGVLLACLWPLQRMEIAVPDASSLPRTADSRIADELLQTQFARPGTTQAIVLEAQPANRPPGVTAERTAETWRQRLLSEPGVLQVEPVPAGAGSGRVALRVTLSGDADASSTRSWLQRWEAIGLRSTPSFLIGGEAKYRQEVLDEIRQGLPYAVSFIGASNFALLFLAFRSLLLPLKAIAMNALSLMASFGILAWIFGTGAWGMEPGPIAVMIPVFIFGLVFGISMDYGVFLLSRIAEAYRRSGNNDRAVVVGLASTSRLITSAAAIMIAVTVPFALGQVAGVRQLGLGIAAAILIDATVLRLVLVPALMKLFGRWNWWAP